MERNTGLPKYKEFKNVEYFNKQKEELLSHLYPDAILNGNKIKFPSNMYDGITAEITAGSIYVYLNNEFKQSHSSLKENNAFELPLVNTRFSLTFSSGKGYMYPRDRSEFPDTELGMEQKAAFFVMVLQVCLAELIKM